MRGIASLASFVFLASFAQPVRASVVCGVDPPTGVGVLDSASVQAGIDCAIGGGPGSEVVLAAGIYDLSEGPFVQGGARIGALVRGGAEGITVRGSPGTILEAVWVPGTIPKVALAIVDSRAITVSGIEFHEGFSHVAAVNVRDLLVEGCTFVDGRGQSIRAGSVQGLTVRDSEFWEWGAAAVFSAGGGGGVTLEDIVAEDFAPTSAPGSGLHIQNHDGWVEIRDVRVSGQTGIFAAVRVVNVTGEISISDSVLSRNDTGVFTTSNAGVRIEDVSLLGNLFGLRAQASSAILRDTKIGESLVGICQDAKSTLQRSDTRLFDNQRDLVISDDCLALD